KPDWSSGTGPGHVARLIEAGDPDTPGDGWWALSLDAQGNRIRFETTPYGCCNPLLETSLLGWSAGTWHLITFSYPWRDLDGSGNAFIAVDGQILARDTANFVQFEYPSKAGRARNGFSVGGNRNGAEQANGQFDELESYNYPL